MERGVVAGDNPWLRSAHLFGSGRDALVALVRWGAVEHGWRRVWLPSFFCPEVPAALLAAEVPGVALWPYADHDVAAPPALAGISAGPGDAVVIVNQLGVRSRPAVERLRAAGAAIIEDHSHDLGSAWALESDADYAYASLRKTLPIPDGGAVWSPRAQPLPPEPPTRTVPSRLSVALLSRPQPEDDRLRYLALARAAAGSEEPVTGAPISPVSRALLPQMPVEAWRERRRANLATLAQAVEDAPGVRALEAPEGSVAFALTLIFDDAEAREAVRQRLVARAVVPAILWPLQAGRDWGAGPDDERLAQRILSIHGDQRFDAAAMRHLAALLREALAG